MAKIINNDALPQMFKMQKELLSYYIEIEGLPEYPIELDTKEGQKVIRDFVNRFTEELSEAYTCLTNAHYAISHNELKTAQKHITEYNGEIADCVHFLMDIFIYSGIDENWFDAQLEDVFKEINLDNLFREKDALGNLFRLANFLNVRDNNKLISSHSYTVFGQREVMDQPEIGGASKLPAQGVNLGFGSFLWKVTHCFNLVIHNLKNRDWHQTTKLVNRIQFYETLSDAIVVFFQFLDFSGISELGLFNGYVLKNHINKERIENGY